MTTTTTSGFTSGQLGSAERAMKVSLLRFRRGGSEEGDLPLPQPPNSRPVFQEGAETLYDSYDRDKAVPVTDESAGNGVLRENRSSFSFYQPKNIAAKRLMYSASKLHLR